MMERLHWKFERFSGIDYRNSASSDKLTKINLLKSSEKGCLLSHVELWEKLLGDENSDKYIIFEDDATTSHDNVLTLINNFYTELNKNKKIKPDILYLGKALDDCANYQKVTDLVYISTHPLCLHAYIITKAGAQKLLSLAPYNLAIDVVVVNAIKYQKILAYAFHPSLFYQDIFNNTSNLRNRASALNLTCECLVYQQHISNDNWSVIVCIIIGLVVAMGLLIIYQFLDF
jgi:GR25 family glycosyltransferase involved in LPS biosynthesis